MLRQVFNPIISSSPHLFNTRRRMGDDNLTLLPQSKIRFRLGYSRNVNDGPAFSTLHQGTEALLFQDSRNTANAYRLGVNYKLLTKTNISYDQVFNYYKGDTEVTDQNQQILNCPMACRWISAFRSTRLPASPAPVLSWSRGRLIPRATHF